MLYNNTHNHFLEYFLEYYLLSSTNSHYMLTIGI